MVSVSPDVDREGAYLVGSAAPRRATKRLRSPTSQTLSGDSSRWSLRRVWLQLRAGSELLLDKLLRELSGSRVFRCSCASGCSCRAMAHEPENPSEMVAIRDVGSRALACDGPSPAFRSPATRRAIHEGSGPANAEVGAQSRDVGRKPRGSRTRRKASKPREGVSWLERLLLLWGSAVEHDRNGD